MLREADRFVFPRENVIDITRVRTARGIEDAFLNVEYDWPVTILRILDSRSEKFRLGNLYRERYRVVSAYTRPEIEMLAIIREDRYRDYMKVKGSRKPSVYCKDDLRMKDIKSQRFFERYWDVDTLCDAIREYRRLSNLAKDEVCLADLLR